MKKFNITVNGTAYKVEVEEVGAAPVAAPAAPAPAAAPAAPVAAGAKEITAPMPGTIVNVAVKAGDAIQKGQVLVVFEAMKMEQEVVAPCDGTIASVNVNQGEAVDTGKVLLTLN
jgi:biotin carboxyl carrier protein